MKKLSLMVVIVLFLGLAVSCSQQKDKTESLPEMLEVNLSIKPANGGVNKPITIEAMVTQGKEKVNDAEVIFEVWRAKDEKHEKVEVKKAEDGLYRLEKSFQQEGTYYVISHVTARDMHNMPKKEFIIGTPSEPENSNTDDAMDGMEME
ncbi:FixH family protein [Neobacillus jeddahensis]|uniref:FixH family protein n=1 Tax=Neobacillus jeddahensis TaxID=1461580 RepID=UPI0005916F12|nr:FixH family protein [Neobacillus jeddahensis]